MVFNIVGLSECILEKECTNHVVSCYLSICRARIVALVAYLVTVAGSVGSRFINMQCGCLVVQQVGLGDSACCSWLLAAFLKLIGAVVVISYAGACITIEAESKSSYPPR